MQELILGAGCFWGVEQQFYETEGVVETQVGYSGGHTENPDYQQVCSGQTGHAEVVKVRFDPEVVSLESLLDIFWRIHNPTTRDRQGPDVGSQYRSILFYNDESQEKTMQLSKERQQAKITQPIVTEIVPFERFYMAEQYHQKYFQKHPQLFCGI